VRWIRLLTVSDISRTAFSIAGVGNFPDQSSPFEIDFYYKNRRDLQTTKILFRFGILDFYSSLRTFSYDANPTKILAKRPTSVEDWAVAVELTPLGN